MCVCVCTSTFEHIHSIACNVDNLSKQRPQSKQYSYSLTLSLLTTNSLTPSTFAPIDKLLANYSTSCFNNTHSYLLLLLTLKRPSRKSIYQLKQTRGRETGASDKSQLYSQASLFVPLSCSYSNSASNS